MISIQAQFRNTMMKQLEITIGTKLSTNQYEETNVGYSYTIKEGVILVGSKSGIEEKAAHNRTTLKLIIQSLEAIASNDISFDIKIISNNYHVVQGINSWLNVWKNNGWKNSKGVLIKNIDLWKNIARLTLQHSIEAIWQTSHHLDLEACKHIAVLEVDKLKCNNQYLIKCRRLKIVKKIRMQS